MKENNTPRAIYLKDYRSPDYWIDTTDLTFILGETETLVTSVLQFRRNPDAENSSAPLVLDGVDLTLLELKLNGQALLEDQYQLETDRLILNNLPERFELLVKTRIKPQNNTSLEGLYKSNGMFCTQCEAEGFRKITYYLDRPDVMSRFSTCIMADKKRYPVLLSNGNPVECGENADGIHWVKWEDPFKKPCYLFALVAGDLSCQESSFTTQSGREVKLQIFVEPQDLDKTDHAMLALKNAMRWDEQVYGREYDLNIYMIVAVSHFNMGAMENKGLNIFNTSCVLAHPKTTTDAGFQRVEGVIAHEYFHNWSGNRVTCRDWFQLSLKEGFTVFRDQEFSADMGSRAIKRVDDVNLLRNAQFTEDAGPMAHPIRPDSYMEINNFYTVTIYEKGAEVVRMLHTLLGPEGFRKGSDLYFQRHDGQAVTCDDFVNAMAHANHVDLSQFKRWYEQAGTPQVSIRGHYNAQEKTYTLECGQKTPLTPNQPSKKPLLIPIKTALMDSSGKSLRFTFNHESVSEAVLPLCQEKQTFILSDVEQSPVPSLLRGFSAPVKLDFNYSRQDLAFLMCHDEDPFNRWESANRLALDEILKNIRLLRDQSALDFDEILMSAYAKILSTEFDDKAEQAQMLQLPSETYIGQMMEAVDVDAIFTVRNALRERISWDNAQVLLNLYQASSTKDYRPISKDIALRSLKNTCLSYLILQDQYKTLCIEQFYNATNMTDQGAALKALAHSEHKEKTELLEAFYRLWKQESLVVNQWFGIQATCPVGDTLSRVKQLLNHPDFDYKNPNKVRALVGSFCSANPVQFHQKSGAGYKFLTDQVLLLDKLNPQVAARILTPLTQWRRYDLQRQVLMRAQLERISGAEKISPDVFEVVTKSLGD